MTVNSKIYVGVAAIALIVIAISFLVSGSTISAAPPGQVSVPIGITDPPHVPNGTTSLVISYSSLQVHTVGQDSSQWISSNTSGTLNLMTLVNVTQTIAGVSLPANSTVDQVKFNIDSATITINGTTSNVTVPSGEVIANLHGSQRFNSSSQILVDISPTVITIFTSNSTVFVLVPSVRAVIIPSNNINLHVGERTDLNASDRGDLAVANAKISLSNLSLSANNSATTLKLTVTNNGNQSVIIRHILLKGAESVNLNLNITAGHNMTDNTNNPEDVNVSGHLDVSNHMNSSNNANVSVHVKISKNIGNSIHANVYGNASAYRHAVTGLNSSHDLNVGLAGNGSELNINMRDLEHFRVLNFLIGANGTLSLPFTLSDVENSSGFTLSPGASHTFVFSGTVVFGKGHLSVSLVPGQNYTVYVIGEETASASANVTAV